MRCIITTEGFGEMVFELYPEHAPLTVKNFEDTAKSGFYDGLAWCRIVKDYVIQAGSPDNVITRREHSSLLYTRMRTSWTAVTQPSGRWCPGLMFWIR